MLVDPLDFRGHFAQAIAVCQGAVHDAVGAHGLGVDGQLPQGRQAIGSVKHGVQGLPARSGDQEAEDQHLAKTQGELEADAGIDQHAGQPRKHGEPPNQRKRLATPETLIRFGPVEG